MMRLASDSLVMSATTVATESAGRPAHVSARPDASRSAGTTAAPASLNLRAMTRPIPRAAPVTTTTFPEKSNLMFTRGLPFVTLARPVQLRVYDDRCCAQTHRLHPTPLRRGG